MYYLLTIVYYYHYNYKQVYLPTIQGYVPNKMVKALLRPFSTSATLSGVMYKMHLIVFTSTARSSKQVVFTQMDLTCLDLMQQSTIYNSFKNSVHPMDFVPPSQN